MNSTLVIDMFSGTGELARAVGDGLNEFTCFRSFSDNYGPARKYLKVRFRNVMIHSDFRDQDVPRGAIVTIGAPCQDLSVAGKGAGAERGSGTRSSLIHEALDMAVAGGADLIIAENVPGGHSVYLALADWLAKEHGYRTTVSSAGAWACRSPLSAASPEMRSSDSSADSLQSTTKGTSNAHQASSQLPCRRHPPLQERGEPNHHRHHTQGRGLDAPHH